MILLNLDLDNTLIYSYKHDIGLDKICVEIYQDREVSFITRQSFDLIKKINKKVIVIPTTTRTLEQYSRIDLGIETPEYALVCNGGILLVNGQEDNAWYEDSLNFVKESQKEIEKAERILENDKYRCFEVRNIRELFVFTKSEDYKKTIEGLTQVLDTSLVDIFSNGMKVYVVPKKLSKGIAVQRLKKRLEAKTVIAAGDSIFDISMLLAADIGIAPADLKISCPMDKKVFRSNKDKLFSDWMLKYVWDIVANK